MKQLAAAICVLACLAAPTASAAASATPPPSRSDLLRQAEQVVAAGVPGFDAANRGLTLSSSADDAVNALMATEFCGSG